MHIVSFKGGFANQLFQLCLYDRLSTIYGKDNVFADISFYKKHCEHGGFKLKGEYDLNYISKIPDNIIKVDENNFSLIKYESHKNYFYEGYWQDEYYIPEDISFIREIIRRKGINKKNDYSVKNIEETNSVSVHVRRGDYLNNCMLGYIANHTYIQNAIDYIIGRIENPVFFVFSDDIDWCKKNIYTSGYKINFIEGNDNDVYRDIYLMSKCKHNIISNSSFSWWGQELNNNNNKIVCSPEYWFNEKISIDKLNKPEFSKIKNVPLNQEKAQNPLFSILIPLYNQENKIRRCLSTVLNQTYANIEVIVVNDASTDNSSSVVSNYCLNDHRIKLINKDRNESLLMARITAINESTGDYILFVDSDDYISLDACEKLKNVVECNSSEIIEFAHFVEPGGVVKHTNADISDDILKQILMGKYPHMVWNKCYSSNLLKKAVNNIDTFYCNMTEDSFLTSIIFASSNTKLYRVEAALYHYVVQGGMSTTKTLSIQDLESIAYSIKNKDCHLKEFFSEQPDYRRYVDISTANDLNYISDVIRNQLVQLPSEKIELLKKLDFHFETEYAQEYEMRIIEGLKLYQYAYNDGVIGYLKLIIKLLKKLSK